jgi:G3E family GTPase
LEVYEEKETKHSHQSHTHHHHDENCGCNSHKHSHSNHDKHCNDKNCSHEHHHDTNRVIGSAKDQQEHSHEHHHAHEHVDTVFFKTDKPLNYDKFGNFVKNLSSDVIRAKGFTWFGDSLPPEQDLKYIVQFVGARRQLSYKPWAKNETKQNAIVFIGKKLKKKDLLAQISSCVIKAAQ